MLIQQPMRSIVSLLTLGAVLMFSFAPTLVDGSGHCLGHNLEPTFNRQLVEETAHGVHHADCYWLRGASDAQTMMVPAQTLLGLASYGPWILPIIQIIDTADLVAFSGRAPPAFC